MNNVLNLSRCVPMGYYLIAKKGEELLYTEGLRTCIAILIKPKNLKEDSQYALMHFEGDVLPDLSNKKFGDSNNSSNQLRKAIDEIVEKNNIPKSDLQIDFAIRSIAGYDNGLETEVSKYVIDKAYQVIKESGVSLENITDNHTYLYPDPFTFNASVAVNSQLKLTDNTKTMVAKLQRMRNSADISCQII